MHAKLLNKALQFRSYHNSTYILKLSTSSTVCLHSFGIKLCSQTFQVITQISSLFLCLFLLLLLIQVYWMSNMAALTFLLKGVQRLLCSASPRRYSSHYVFEFGTSVLAGCHFSRTQPKQAMPKLAAKIFHVDC